jgi:subtilase family serine protease
MERAPDGFVRAPFWALPDVKDLKSLKTKVVPSGIAPTLARHAYGFDQITNQGAGQTIGIVDAYDDPNIQNDLNEFDTVYSLPACNGNNGCFRKIYASGFRPRSNSGWALEMSLDVEWAHTIAPQANIILVEASSSSFSALFSAVEVAVENGASVVSMSWGGGESSFETLYDSTYFSHTGVTFTASSGDSGDGVIYPAASADVIGVGGTTLTTDATGDYVSETAWSGSGGGQSSVEHEPSYQATFPIPDDSKGARGVPDVSYDANPDTGFAVYDSVPYDGFSGWWIVGGTSAGAPQWAALFAITNSLRVAAGKADLSATANDVYAAAKAAYATDFHDITSGTNGVCGTLCTAAPGYDYVTGLGSPQAAALIPELVSLP